MPTVRDILNGREGVIYSIGPDASVLEATRLMNQRHIGALAVVQDGRMIGIFTERDVLRRVVGEERAPAQVRVAEVMTSHVVCCRPQTTLDEARSVMKNRRIRHLPVINDSGTLVGMVSIGDLNAYRADDQETTIYLLHEYLYGRT